LTIRIPSHTFTTLVWVYEWEAELGGKLKPLQVANLVRKHTVGLYNDGNGLYLQVGSNSASWIFRYKFESRRTPRDMGLGSASIVSLAEAREKTLRCRKLLLDDRDPLEERRATRAQRRLETAKGMTFRQCAEAYIAAHEAGWRNPKHAAQWPATLGAYVYPVFGALPVQAIDVGLVLKALEPIWLTKPETAGRVRGRIESVIDWATARGYRTGENPARWRGHLDHLLPARSKVRRVEHHAALPYAELPSFMAELRQQEGIGARALEFTILMVARTGEVIGARWEEINLAERLWIVPAQRMKAGKEHRVPLSDATIAILEERAARRQSDFVFPGERAGRPLSNMAMAMLLRRMGRLETVHGFRSAFSDWCAERTNFPSEVREMALAHTVSDKVEAAYRRGDLFQKRRQLAEAWARHCATSAQANGLVVPLRVAAK
jgi:integrase